jgi:hypothetical protein
LSLNLSEPLQIALIGAVGALIAALLQPFVQKLTNIGAKIRVKVEMKSFSVPKFLRTGINAYSWDYKQTPKPSEALKKRLLFLQQTDGNLIVEIRNVGKKILSDVSVHLENDDDKLYEIHADGTTSDTHLAKVVAIPQVRPESNVRVEIWCKRDYVDRSVWVFKRPIVVRAAEYQRIVYRLAWPQGIRSRYFLLNRRLGYAVAIVIWLVVMISSSAIKIHW